MNSLYDHAHPWFAWRPVQTSNQRWAWMKIVIRYWQPGMLLVHGSHGHWEYVMPEDVTYTKRPRTLSQ